MFLDTRHHMNDLLAAGWGGAGLYVPLFALSVLFGLDSSSSSSSSSHSCNRERSIHPSIHPSHRGDDG